MGVDVIKMAAQWAKSTKWLLKLGLIKNVVSSRRVRVTEDTVQMVTDNSHRTNICQALLYAVK